MKYVGSKRTIAKEIAKIINPYSRGKTFIEPFVGGCNLVEHIQAKEYICSDVNECMITMYNAIKEGWKPRFITEEEYKQYKKIRDPKDPMTAFALLCCSWRNMWAKGYGEEGRIKYSVVNVPKIKDTIQKAIFIHRSYHTIDVEDCVIYCDPPYANTHADYVADSRKFKSLAFWNWAREQSKKNVVFISEYSAPPDFECVLSVDQKKPANKMQASTEKLFRWRGERR
jgi:DNA adenine methylase